jgi:von Willebrand factor type A domain.
MLDKMLKELDGNQMGIVSYAGEAFPQAFLTRDGNALRWVIDRGVTVSSAPGEGSNIAKAIELALAMFDADSKPTNERIIVLLSDGGNDSEPQELIEQISEAKSRGIKVIVVALGNIMPSKIPVSKLAHDDDAAKALLENGKTWYEINGQIEKTGMNAQLLQAIANAAGGQFIHMQSLNDLNMLDHVGNKSKVSVKGTTELFPYALSLALALFAACYAVTNRFSLRRDSSNNSATDDAGNGSTNTDNRNASRSKDARKGTRNAADDSTTDGANDYWR